MASIGNLNFPKCCLSSHRTIHLPPDIDADKVIVICPPLTLTLTLTYSKIHGLL